MFHVGLLYSCQELISFLKGNKVNYNDFLEAFKGNFGVVPGKNVIELAQSCNWIDINTAGILIISSNGDRILKAKSYIQALRIQLLDMINTLKPNWSKLIPKGRKELSTYLDEDTLQCFRDANLLGRISDDIISWWDTVAISVFNRVDETLILNGRKAEKLTVKYEKKRTGFEPDWKSIDTNLCGYDILSRVSKSDKSALNIEVKGTTQRKSVAKFHISSFQWEIATSSQNYLFYLWLLYDPRKPIIKSVGEVGKHIPKNFGLGKWEKVEIPFSI